jgi:predicted transcriptional regulator
MDEQEALNQWQIEEIKKALIEANRGKFASEEEVERTFTKWKSK